MAGFDHILGRGRKKVAPVHDVVFLVGDVDLALVLLSWSSGQPDEAAANILTRERNSGRVAPSRR